MTDETNELDALMRAARARPRHMIAAVAAVMALITITALTSWSSHELPGVIIWLTGCGIFGVLATVWYRARLRSIARLRNAVQRGEPVTRIVVSELVVAGIRIPIGTEVDMLVVHEGTIPVHTAVGFWTRAAADRVLTILEPNIAAGAKLPPLRAIVRAPHPRTKNLPRAVVSSQPRDERRPE
ncbi:MAG: hypothetical protein AB7O24_10130 [Kofleriaceae bacterium]